MVSSSPVLTAYNVVTTSDTLSTTQLGSFCYCKTIEHCSNMIFIFFFPFFSSHFPQINIQMYISIFLNWNMSLQIRIPSNHVHGPNAPRVDGPSLQTNGQLKQQIVSLRAQLLTAQNHAHHWHSKYKRLEAKVASSTHWIGNQALHKMYYMQVQVKKNHFF